MSYTAENFIEFIEWNRNDKISSSGLKLIAEKFREQEQQLKQLNVEPISLNKISDLNALIAYSKTLSDLNKHNIIYAVEQILLSTSTLDEMRMYLKQSDTANYM